MTPKNESKEERQLRQTKQWRQMLRDIKQDVAKSYYLKVQHDAHYVEHRFKEEVVLS